jgi:hypothetical protein
MEVSDFPAELSLIGKRVVIARGAAEEEEGTTDATAPAESERAEAKGSA